MQCPKCGNSQNVVSAQCDKCGVYFHKIKSVHQSSTPQITKSRLRYILPAVIITALLALPFGVSIYTKYIERTELLSSAEQKIRLVNGLVGETLDPKESIAGYEFSRKSLRRIQELDGVVAQIMAIDGTYSPELLEEVISYTRLARTIIKETNNYVGSEIELKAALVLLSNLQEKVRSNNLSAWIDIPHAELESAATEALRKVEQERDLTKKAELLKEASLFGSVYELRADMQSAKAAHAKAAKALDLRKEALNKYINDFNKTGEKIVFLSGENMPVIRLSLI